jgi:hypothetical protein
LISIHLLNQMLKSFDVIDTLYTSLRVASTNTKDLVFLTLFQPSGVGKTRMCCELYRWMPKMLQHKHADAAVLPVYLSLVQCSTAVSFLWLLLPRLWADHEIVSKSSFRLPEELSADIVMASVVPYLVARRLARASGALHPSTPVTLLLFLDECIEPSLMRWIMSVSFRSRGSGFMLIPVFSGILSEQSAHDAFPTSIFVRQNVFLPLLPPSAVSRAVSSAIGTSLTYEQHLMCFDTAGWARAVEFLAASVLQGQSNSMVAGAIVERLVSMYFSDLLDVAVYRELIRAALLRKSPDCMSEQLKLALRNRRFLVDSTKFVFVPSIWLRALLVGMHKEAPLTGVEKQLLELLEFVSAPRIDWASFERLVCMVEVRFAFCACCALLVVCVALPTILLSSPLFCLFFCNERLKERFHSGDVFQLARTFVNG